MSDHTIQPLLSSEEKKRMAREEGSNWRKAHQGEAVDGAEEVIEKVCAIFEADRAKTAARLKAQELVIEKANEALEGLKYSAECDAITWDCHCEDDSGITCSPCQAFNRVDAAIALINNLNK